MTRYLLDTNHASALLRSQAGLIQKLGDAIDAEFHLCMPSLGELYFMVFNSARVDENRRTLEQLCDGFKIADYDIASAVEFGRIQGELRKSGRPVPAIDAQIAAIARHHEYVLLTADAHFNVINNLKVENWIR